MVSSHSDPFLTKPVSVIPKLTISRDSTSHRTLADGESDREIIEEEVKKHEEMSEDELTRNDNERPMMHGNEGKEATEDEEEGEEDDQEEGEEEDEEEEESEEEEVEEGANSDGSAFIISDEEVSEDDESEPSPPRRLSSVRRKDSNPIKRTPAKIPSRRQASSPLTPGAVKGSKMTHNATPKATSETEKSRDPMFETPGPLSERAGQLQLGDDDDDELPIKTTVKKKR